MKNYLKYFLLLMVISCKAQEINITDYDGEPITGAYYKDINHLLDPFVGTYVYTNGNDTLKFVFQKMEYSSPQNNRYHEDLLVGEYRYVKNGVEKANTLPRFNEGYTNGRNYSVSSNFLDSGYNFCSDCLPTEKLLNTGLSDCLSDRTAYFTVRRKTVSGQPAIQISIAWRSDGFGRNRTAFEPAPPQPALPNGEFILLKQ